MHECEEGCTQAGDCNLHRNNCPSYKRFAYFVEQTPICTNGADKPGKDMASVTVDLTFNEAVELQLLLYSLKKTDNAVFDERMAAIEKKLSNLIY